MCDAEYHFTTQVISRARIYPPLIDAILAVSASHIRLTKQKIDSDLARHYYQRCLDVLIPELSRVQPDHLDDLLAATVILRLHEELDGPLPGSENFRHSIGTRALLQQRQPSHAAQPTSLAGIRRAAAWAGVRQEIYAAIRTHRPPTIAVSADMLEHMASSASDSAWCDRAVSHCLDVLGFCFGDNSINRDMYDALLEANAQWEAARPASYDPLCFCTRNEAQDEANLSWDIRYQADWHANGWCYNSMARLLLVIHNPRQPRVGLNRITAWDKVLKEVHYVIKLLCFIAQCRPASPGPSLVACMSVWLAGDFIEDPRSQKQILAVLASTEQVHGWPTGVLAAELRGHWSRAEGVSSIAGSPGGI